ncbi:hypothetical protein ACF3M2_12875 [Tissierella carlieri]|nr:hypothetical protein [uncultured Tissierella sp.]MDU5082404.1 hypothetical protein [Bacillota bacterium]
MVTNILLFIFLTIHLNNISWPKWLQIPLHSPSILFTIIKNRILSRGKNPSIVSRILNYIELIKKLLKKLDDLLEKIKYYASTSGYKITILLKV